MRSGNESPGPVSDRPSEADSFAACLHTAMAYWGRDASYGCIAALSGTAFAPALRNGTACSCCWLEFGSDSRTDFLGHALGFSTEKAEGQPDSYLDEPFASHVRAALARGAVLVAGPTPRWTLWTSWPDVLPEKPHELICANATLCPECTNTRIYLLRPLEPCLTRAEATREALTFAAAAATGQVQTECTRFGVSFYDSWLEQLNSQGDLCPANRDVGSECVRRMLRRTRWAQLSAVHFLGRAQEFVPALRENTHVAGALAAYQDMATSVAGLIETWGLPTAGKQGCKSELMAVLRAIRDLHQQATAHLSAVAAIL